MTAAPVAPGAIALGQGVAEPGIVLIRPLVGSVDGIDTAAALSVEQLAAVLRAVNETRPVVSACEVRSALVVGILEREDAQLIVGLCCERTDGQQRADHHNGQHERQQALSARCGFRLHKRSLLLLINVYRQPPERQKQGSAPPQLSCRGRFVFPSENKKTAEGIAYLSPQPIRAMEISQ